MTVIYYGTKITVLQVGDIAVQRIVEHEIPVYHPSEFFDEATAEAVEPHREWLEPKALCPRTGRMVMPVQSYLVRTRHHCILIDTCVGCHKSYSDPPEWHQSSNEVWLSNLEAAGVHPEDIDYVFCTHLHSDHCGWNTHLVGGRWVPTFPKAKYVFARDEYRAMEEENHPIFIDNVQPIMEAKLAVLVDLDYALDDDGCTIGIRPRIWQRTSLPRQLCYTIYTTVSIIIARRRTSILKILRRTQTLIHCVALRQPLWHIPQGVVVLYTIEQDKDVNHDRASIG